VSTFNCCQEIEDLRRQIGNMEEFIAEHALWPDFETWLSLPPVKIQSPADLMREAIRQANACEIPPEEAQRRVVQIKQQQTDEIWPDDKLVSFADLIGKRK
jgi:hypothetical protein